MTAPRWWCTRPPRNSLAPTSPTTASPAARRPPTPMGDQPSETPRRYSRRRLLLTGAAAAAGGAATVAIGGVALAGGRESSAERAAVPTMDSSIGTAGSDGAATVPFHGPHQAGISTPAQAYATFCAFDLREG